MELLIIVVLGLFIVIYYLDFSIFDKTEEPKENTKTYTTNSKTKENFGRNFYQEFEDKSRIRIVQENSDFCIKYAHLIAFELTNQGYTINNVPASTLLLIISGIKIDLLNKQQQFYQSHQQTHQNFKDQHSHIKNNNSVENEYFSILEIDPTKNFETIRTAYRTQMKKYHPDKFTTASKKDKELSESKSKRINEAYSFLEKKYKN